MLNQTLHNIHKENCVLSSGEYKYIILISMIYLACELAEAFLNASV